MSAADDCGVNGGCGACPLFAANVCGDPAPETLTNYIEQEAISARMHAAGLSRLLDPAPYPARFVVDSTGSVTDRGVWAPVIEAYLVAAVAALDAPDVDPAEPAPAGGCCGGGCSP